jgi:hypothetical protein
MSKVITHPLLVRPSSATRGLIGVVPNQIAAVYNASSCQIRMSNVCLRRDPIHLTYVVTSIDELSPLSDHRLDARSRCRVLFRGTNEAWNA